MTTTEARTKLKNALTETEPTVKPTEQAAIHNVGLQCGIVEVTLLPTPQRRHGSFFRLITTSTAHEYDTPLLKTGH